MSPRLGRNRPTVHAGAALVAFLAAFVLTFLGPSLLAGSSWASAAGIAQAATVILVRPPRPSAVTTEATVRLRGELGAAGFDVRVVDQPPGEDVRTALEQAAAGPDVEAVVAILGKEPGGGDAGKDSAELWVIDRVTGKTVVRRVAAPPTTARAAELLSVRALELLRASFLEVALAAGRAPKADIPKPPPAAVTRFAEQPLVEALEDRSRSSWAIEVGGCVIGSLDGMQPSLLPTARVQRRFGERLFARVTVAGLGTRARLNAPSGTVEVSQQFGLVEGAWRFFPDRRLQPFLWLGAGAARVAAAGQPSSPYEGLSDQRWSLLGDGGAGLRLALGGRFELALEAHAQVAQPYPAIHFFDVSVASEGRPARPTLLSTLTVVAWL